MDQWKTTTRPAVAVVNSPTAKSPYPSPSLSGMIEPVVYPIQAEGMRLLMVTRPFARFAGGTARFKDPDSVGMSDPSTT